MSSRSSLDAVAGEPADADGFGDAVADDPADADAAGNGDSDGWVQVCSLDRLTPYRGVAALVDGRQVALFRLSGTEVRAIDNRDPFSCAHVMSRGVVGDAKGVPKVASPVYKQSFDLRTGRCLDDPGVEVPTYDVRVDDDGSVFVAVPRGDSP
jgi:nitrite reductase (NADH) small subunit